MEELKQLMKEAGIVGAGGAGFPSFAKLAEGADTLVINGAECEPLLYTDFTILGRELSLIVYGATKIVQTLNARRAVLCIKRHRAKELNLTDGEKLADKITVKTLPEVYPMGDEVSLIYQATGKVVKPGALPITAGVIVYNVETVYNIARAIKFGDKVTYKWLTISGNVKKPAVVRVPVGTPVRDLFRKLGITVSEEDCLVDGGPAMGKITDLARASVTKTTKSLLVLPESTPAIQYKKLDVSKSIVRAETACCQCTHCTEMCPRALLGYPLEPHKLVRTAKSAAEVSPELVISATLCCGCGICESIACCQGISPRAVIDGYKAILAKNKLKFRSDAEVHAKPEHEYRMIPTTKLMSALGVTKYDVKPEFAGEIKDFNRVEIRLKQHIGAPSVAIVNEGDTVDAGQKIAESGEGLSLPQYASISGKVTLIDGEKIIIDRVEE